ncbi:HBS1-like protein isoform X2 [Cephus cinctus]|uniref:HBS1-like protein isoform X2 n=1 Tax=Cephus cinctus TaxID=211228 RepID=A0AAJ7RTG2_CEPCN|nr:HBS1-like protein isoform X2 [Cephus cinctus]
MSRHRDVRSMNYSDEYDGYDDVYGHSVEDDYCVSPSAEQFMFDRNKRQNIASYFTEEDIVEGNEDMDNTTTLVPPGTSFTHKSTELSNLDAAKLSSCIEAIRNVIGDTVSDSTLIEKILQSNFNTEAALDAILKESSPKDTTGNKTASKAAPFQTGVSPAVRVVPAATRSIVKGFDLSGSDNSDLVHSRISSSSRSQSPSSGQNSPDIKRKDDQNQKDKRTLIVSSSKSNTPSRCQSPASGRATPESESKCREKSLSIENKIDAMTAYRKKRGDAKEQLHLVVVGHVDAGKSTLLGRLLCDLDQVPARLIHKYQQESKKIGKQSFAYAWVLDETGEERERGITMDVGHSKFETATKSVTILDAPGHKDFIPNMITGATQADVALLVVDATRGEFETGFDSGGQTREHALLLRSLGITQLAVVVNKLDTVGWSKERFNEIVEKMNIFLKQAGFRDAVPFVPCSGLSGENLVMEPKEEGLSSWYTGPTLVSVIDSFKCPERPINKPFRFSVNDIFKGTGSGFCVSGHVETGMVSVSDKVLVLPYNEVALVRGLQIDDISITSAFAGDHVALTLSGIEQQSVAVGDILCTPQYPVRTTTRFEAHIVLFAVATPITKGLPVVMHQQSLVEPAVIVRLIAQLHRGTGEIIKKKPRCLPKNSSAIVEIRTQRPIGMELYKDVKQLGRVMLRVAGTTVAAGLVTKIY